MGAYAVRSEEDAATSTLAAPKVYGCLSRRGVVEGLRCKEVDFISTAGAKDVFWDALFHTSGRFGTQYVNKVIVLYLKGPVDSVCFW